jgi:hypothetical protein
MFASQAPGPRLSLRHALAGLQSGVFGGIALLGCVMLGSILNGRSIWVVPNLFATVFLGSRVYRNEYLITSWAGIALLVAIYGLLGVVWGMIWRENRKPGLALFGAIAGLAVYFLFFDLIWPALAPMVTLYAPDRQLQIGHILWGVSLAKSPTFARRIADQTAAPVVVEVDEVIR